MNSLFIILSLVFLNTASAEKKIKKMTKGDIAPYSGTLFNDEAAASIVVNLETQDHKCQIKVDEALLKQRAELNYNLEICKIELKYENKRHEAIQSVTTDELQLYRDEIKLGSTKRTLWFSGGVIAGILLTSVSALSLSKISNVK